MPIKDPERRREHNRRYYYESNGKARILERNIANRAKKKEYVWKLKENPCVDCGQTFHPMAMQFDHLADKFSDISQMVNRNFSIEKLDEEIAKCDLVCANCHAVRTWQRQQAPIAQSGRATDS
jgi:hypothetical protein